MKKKLPSASSANNAAEVGIALFKNRLLGRFWASPNHLNIYHD
jgi:hypothetical protein